MALKLASLFGLFTFIAIAWALSTNRKQFPWRTVLWGLGLQLAVATLILKTPLGRSAFDLARRAVSKLEQFAADGARMVFGPLADGAALAKSFGPSSAFVLAISITGTIIVVASLSSLLYHWGVLQRVVLAMAWVMKRAMKTSGSETLAAAANIFMGQTEAPLLVRPYILRMTQSELLALMVCGMSTIAGGVLVIYSSMGADTGHLVTASVMSAPAGLLIAKVMLPETEAQGRSDVTPAIEPTLARNSIDALCRGASDGMMLSLNVIAMLIAFVAAVSLAEFLFSWILRPLGFHWTLREVLGWINAPVAWLLGIPWRDCPAIGQALGERILLNEFLGYVTLIKHQSTLEPRSFVLATYALCGFANFGSIAIQIGGIGALVPERRGDLAALGIRAMIGGLLACYMTSCVVGLLL